MNLIENAVNVIYPYPVNDIWVFDDKSRGLKAEPFVFGSSEILTALTKIEFGMLGMEKFKLTFSKYPLPEIHAKFVKTNKEAESGAWYTVVIDNQFVNGRMGWLCPATLKYFKDYPDIIYIYLEELNGENNAYSPENQMEKRTGHKDRGLKAL